MGILDELDEGDLTASSRLLRKAVPAYDYRTREARASTDREIRDAISRRLDAARRHAEDATNTLYRDGHRDAVKAMDDLSAAIEILQRRVRAASPGGGAAGGLAGLSEEALVEHDAALVKDADDVIEATAELADLAFAGEAEEAGCRAREARCRVRELDRGFTDRRDHLVSVT